MTPQTPASPSPPEPSPAGPSLDDKGPASTCPWFLDPQILHRLMACGGAIMTVGLGVWMWSAGLFANPVHAATLFGVANLGLLAGGGYLREATRYRTVGLAIALLACAAMPMQLWFYSAQGLIAINAGGHLWIAAAIICVIYAATAWRLREPAFAYAFVGGVAMTGMLWLADLQVQRLVEVTAPTSFFIALGLIAMHAERFFPLEPGPFSRARFGQAFFRAGATSLALGAAALATAYGLFHIAPGILRNTLYWWSTDRIAQAMPNVGIAAGLMIAAAYGYGYAYVAVRRRRRWAAASLTCGVAAGLMVFDTLAIRPSIELACLAASLAAAIAATYDAVVSRRAHSSASDGRLVAALAALPLELGGVNFAFSSSGPWFEGWRTSVGWITAGAFAAATFAGLVSSCLVRGRDVAGRIPNMRLAGVGLGLTVFAAG
ncbi:MAG: hypothetical protein KDA61_02595, partial [Planctomycetales bacterium]|nr:hypothetical protein [Planctomycetales bacterium]